MSAQVPGVWDLKIGDSGTRASQLFLSSVVSLFVNCQSPERCTHLATDFTVETIFIMLAVNVIKNFKLLICIIADTTEPNFFLFVI